MSTPRHWPCCAARDRTFALLLIGLLLAVARPLNASPRLVGDRFVNDQDQPEIAAWAAGVQSVAELDSYAAVGFDLIYVPLPYNGSARDLVRAAAAKGLGVILALQPIAATGSGRLRMDDPAAVRMTAKWLAETAEEWRDTPGLVAWALQDDVEEAVDWSAQGFAQYLSWKYARDPVRLSVAWGAEIDSFDEASGELGPSLDALRPGGIGQPSMDHAAWRRDGVQALLRRWATTIATIDPLHPVIGGRMDRFRTLLAAPEELAGLQPAMLPAGGWHDAALHQPGAVAAAAQAGRYAAVPWLQAAADPASLIRWTRLMFGRGAAGVAFDDWTALASDPARLAAVKQALREATQNGAASFRPAASAAVVLSPLIRGPQLGPRSVFGYGTAGGDEPAGLLEMLRVGSRHGPLDVLQIRDLQRVDLSRYGAILLPAAFDLTLDGAGMLQGYVRSGGILFSDLGAGAMAMGGDLRYLPPPLVEVFGLELKDVRLLEEVALNDRQRQRLRNLPPGELAFPDLLPTISHPGSLVFQRQSSLFPEIQPVIGTPPGMAATLLRCPTGFFQPTAPSCRIVAEQTEIGGRPGTAPAFAGLAVNPYGAGLGVFCGNFLWQAWKPGELLFDAVHDGILRQRAALSEVSRLALCDPNLQVVRGMDDRLWLHRVNDRPAQVQLEMPSLDGRIYVPGFTAFRRPLPKDAGSPVRAQFAPFMARRIVDLAGGSLQVEAPAPIVLWAQGDGVAVDVSEYSADRIYLRVFGTGEQARLDLNNRWEVLDPQPCEATLAIEDGLYEVKPGSLHRAEWWIGPHQVLTEGPRVGRVKRYETLTAGPDGRLTIRRRFADELLRLSPVAAPDAAADAG